MSIYLGRFNFPFVGWQVLSQKPYDLPASTAGMVCRQKGNQSKRRHGDSDCIDASQNLLSERPVASTMAKV